MNETYVTIIGNVASEVRCATTDGGVAVASFRVASTPRRYGPSGWTDGQTSYVTVKCWRGLADNVQKALKKGEPVIVHGRQTVRQWERDERSGTSVDIDADAVGHDLRWGTTAFTKTTRVAQEREGTDAAATELASSFDTEGPDGLPAAARTAAGRDDETAGSSPGSDDDGWAVPGSGATAAAAA